MLKRISVNQLTLGMHVKEFCGSWMEHPFWRTGFLLKSSTDRDAILASSIKEVWIDCDKGSDVEPGLAPVSEQEVQMHAEEELARAQEQPHHSTPVVFEAEVERASKICLQARQAVVSMFEEARMGNTVDAGGARQLVEEIAGSVARNPGALISLARLKTADAYTYMHSVAVCAMMVALAKQMGFDEERTRSAGLAGLMHDLGKARLPLAVLNKPGKLSSAEFALVQIHPAEGHRLLRLELDVDPMVLDVCLHHHEKMDGSGYPERLNGDQISLFARMGAVCDVYDAITSNRPYKSGWDPAVSLRKMAEWMNSHFDPVVFQAFVKCMGIYPVGSLVRLSSGRIGVVTEQGEKSLTTPRVKVFYSTASSTRITPQVIDLARDTSERIAGREDPAQWRFPDLNEMWLGLGHAPW